VKSCEKHPGDKRYKNGACAPCAVELASQWAKRNPDKRKASGAAWRERNKEYHRSVIRAGHYRAAGVDPKQAAVFLAAHGGLCDCCGKDISGVQRRCVDHDHLTGRIRGALCHSCNLGIGMLGDSIEGVMNAVRYLKKE
jgi:hypothetical protein